MDNAEPRSGTEKNQSQQLLGSAPALLNPPGTEYSPGQLRDPGVNTSSRNSCPLWKTLLGARQRHCSPPGNCCSATPASGTWRGKFTLGKALPGHEVVSGEMSPRRPPQLHLLIPKRDNTHTHCMYRATDPLPTTTHRPTLHFYQKKPRMLFIPQKTHLTYYISNFKCIWNFFQVFSQPWCPRSCFGPQAIDPPSTAAVSC